MKKILLCRNYLILFIFATSTLVIAQTSTTTLQKDAAKLANESLNIGGSVFAKSDYRKASEYLTDANELINDNKNPEKTIEYLNQAIELFKKTIEAAKGVNANFSSLMKTRQLVLIHGLSENTMKVWKDAEDNFISVYENFLDKDNEDVKKYSAEAEQKYKEAELISIKDQYLLSVKNSLAKAEDEKIEKFAPKTVVKIKQLITETENILNSNRYDTLAAKKNITSAMYEINHGLYMQSLFTKMNKEDKTWEDLQLSWEEPVAKVAADMKIAPTFDSDVQNLASKILESNNQERNKLAASQKEAQNLKAEIVQLKKTIDDTNSALTNSKSDNLKLTAQLDTAKKKIEGLNKVAEEMKSKLAVIEQENVKFKADSETLEKNQKLVESISALFLPSEAEVIKNGELITIRLVNLNFPQNKATLEPQYFTLLTKVQKAIQTFPNGTTVIEGHTDGVGNYQANLDLSQSRANSVYQYLISTMGAEAAKISVVGLGGSKPIANNSSEEGKAKNRRIEIVINPHLPTTK